MYGHAAISEITSVDINKIKFAYMKHCNIPDLLFAVVMYITKCGVSNVHETF